MLDNAIKEQLKSVFAVLENNVELVCDESTHEDQKELIEMLQDVASTSTKIIVKTPAGGNAEKTFSPNFILNTRDAIQVSFLKPFLGDMNLHH